MAVLKISPNFQYLWHRFIGDCYSDSQGFISLTNDGDLLLTGTTELEELIETPWLGEARPYVSKINSSTGEDIWVTMIDTIMNEGTAVKTLDLGDGTFIGAGYDKGGGYRVVITRFTLDGDSLWYRAYEFEPERSSQFRDIIPTNDGGFIAVGKAMQDETSAFQESWALKVDEHGCLVPGCHLVNVPEYGKLPSLRIGPNPAFHQLNV